MRCQILFTGVFLYSFLTWLSTHLLPEAIRLITLVLIITCVIEMFFSFNKWFRWTMELLIFLIILILLNWKYIRPEEYTLAMILESLWNLLQLENFIPILMITISSWLIYLFMIRWFASKWRVLATILISTISLSIYDTFTFLELWSDVTIMVTASLSLLVIHHFKALRKKSAEGWEHLMDYPGTVIGTIVIFFSVIILTSAFTPEDIRPLLTDPYTAWKNYQGEEAAVSRYTDGSSSYDRLSGDSRSGYSRDDSQLGGAFDYDYSPVMTVDTSLPTYYRGETRYFYNGNGWEKGNVDDRLEDHQLLSIADEEVLRQRGSSPVDRSLLQTKEVKQTITFSEKAAYSGNVLLGSYRMESVAILDQIEREEEVTYESAIYQSLKEDQGLQSSLLWLPTVAELYYFDASRMFPREYQVISEVPLLDEEGLREAPSIDRNDDFWEKYLQLPNELPKRISELSEEIVAEQTNTYDQVKAIESYLKETYTYTTEPNESLGESDDFVDRFLFEVKEGYCDYFSTSMVVLTRTLGIPARWVKGYTHGNRIHEVNQYYLDEMDPLAPGVFEIRNANAHSWVEVYFPGYGWIPFEPTATFSQPTLEVQEETEAPLSNQNEIESAEEEQKKNLSIKINGQTILIAIGVVIIASTSLILLWGHKHEIYWHIWKKRSGKTVNEKIILEVERLLHFGKRREYDSLNSETLQETFTRWTNQNIQLEKNLKIVVTLFEKAKYGPENMTENELILIQEKITEIRNIM